MAEYDDLHPTRQRQFCFAPAVFGTAFVVIGVLALVPDVADAATAWVIILAAMGVAGLVSTLAAFVRSVRT